jgi:LuxR family quorum sensing-dependent transcriptional regulator
MSAVEYGRDALDFIEGLNGHTAVAAAMNAVEGAFCCFGFETLAGRMVQALYRKQF